MVGVGDSEFWRITPSQLWLKYQAYRQRFDEREQIRAHNTAVVANMWTKKKLKGDHIYKQHPLVEAITEVQSNDEKFQELEESFEKACDNMGVKSITEVDL